MASGVRVARLQQLALHRVGERADPFLDRCLGIGAVDIVEIDMIDAEIGEWWTAFIEADEEERVRLISVKPKTKANDNEGPKKRRPRRSNRRRPKAADAE
mgnify:CR=1 FL=1